MQKLLALLAVLSAGSYAQSKVPGMTWSSLGELPKFVGVWEIGRFGGGPPQPMSLTPKYAAMQKAYREHAPEDTPAANCVPPGMPGIMTQPYPIEILFTPGKVTILIEGFRVGVHVTSSNNLCAPSVVKPHNSSATIMTGSTPAALRKSAASASM